MSRKVIVQRCRLTVNTIIIKNIINNNDHDDINNNGNEKIKNIGAAVMLEYIQKTALLGT